MKKQPEYKLRAAAKKDISDIFSFSIKKWSGATASAYVRDIYSMLDLVAKKPKIGREYRTRKGLSVRRFIVNSHLIVYRETKKGVTILRVVHQSMDPDHSL